MLKIHKGKILSCHNTNAGGYSVSIVDSFTNEKEVYRALEPIFSKDEIFFYLDEQGYYIERAFKVNPVSTEKIDKEINQGRAILANSPVNQEKTHAKSSRKKFYSPTLWE